MLQKALRLWVACRFIESKWRCWADSGGEDSEIRAATPKDPFWDWDSLPPYLDYQIASIVIHRVLGPLRKDVLRELQGTFNTHSPKDWYVTFLTSFILLQNYELQMNFQRQFALRRQAQVGLSYVLFSVRLRMQLLTNLMRCPGEISRYAARSRHQLGGQDDPGPFPLLLQRPAALHKGI